MPPSAKGSFVKSGQKNEPQDAAVTISGPILKKQLALGNHGLLTS
jgi:hypothetical protein